MEKIYSTGYDHDVKKVVLYCEDNRLYKSYPFTDESIISARELEDLFMKGMIVIFDNGDLYYPTACHRGENGYACAVKFNDGIYYGHSAGVIPD